MGHLACYKVASLVRQPSCGPTAEAMANAAAAGPASCFYLYDTPPIRTMSCQN